MPRTKINLLKKVPLTLKRRNYVRAIEQFNKAIAINPKNYMAYYYRGYSKYSTEDYHGAILDFTVVIKPYPNEPKFYFYRGNALSALEYYREAISDFTKAIELNPNDADAYFYRGFIRINAMIFKEHLLIT